MAKRVKNDVRERFGFAVRVLREARGLTQEELAHRSGIHRTYLSDLERGTRNVALVNIERLANSLTVSLGELFAKVG
jgi:transcriptional regulator with XRE-family HTH domain